MVYYRRLVLFANKIYRHDICKRIQKKLWFIILFACSRALVHVFGPHKSEGWGYEQ